MNGLLIFTVYTFAMIGVALIAFLIWKKTNMASSGSFGGNIKIEDSLSLSPRKMLLVVKVKNEKFLLASDIESTTFLAKLENEEIPNFQKYKKIETIQEAKAPTNLQNIKTMNVLKELTKTKLT
jgi:flagellar biogenesis protein FliO